MPQMSPMPWFSLMIFYLLILFLMTSIIYFSSMNLKSTKIMEKKNFFSLQW
uniref:ATP synthase complex subunit 8 n=1 Tax=Freysuila caesalpiniae TaxID=2008487 RepID=A0A344A2C1_9HEMI|nr:ATP synthase F0 subunit 8 [Freysuila caesalpiniae]AWU48912.1 ATP synthase F0 subunit 8 [Freysuila caesalpiniae]